MAFRKWNHEPLACKLKRSVPRGQVVGTGKVIIWKVSKPKRMEAITNKDHLALVQV